MRSGQQKRSLEPIIAAQPAKHFRPSDVCGDADNPLQPHSDIVMEGLEAEKHGDCPVKGDLMVAIMERISPNRQEEAGTASKRKQQQHDDFPLSEQQALERMKPALELQAQCSLQSFVPSSFVTSSSVHRSHAQWLPSSSFIPVQNQLFQQNALAPEMLNDEAQARYDIQDGLPHRRVPLGSIFQAFVPAWRPSSKSRISAADEVEVDTSNIDDSSRWLGLQVWPLQETESAENEDEIGKGRSLSCACLCPGSVDCIRLHIQEENEKLKGTLGKAYQLWGFHDMGEPVSQHWSIEEQEQFKLLVKAYPASSENSFWHYLPSLFPTRSTRDFVHYYFNVFVLQRRAIQNRVDPDNVDSDDDDCSLTGSDSQESEDYLTDMEEVADHEDGSEDDAEDESWQNVIEGGTETSSEVSTSSEAAVQSDQHILSNHDVGHYQDDVPSTEPMEDFVSSSNSKEDVLADLQSISHMIRSPQYISSRHHNTQVREKRWEGTSYGFGESGYHGSKVLDGCLLEVDRPNVHRGSILVNNAETNMCDILKPWDRERRA